MPKHTLPTRSLLACGAVAGPLYVTSTVIQSLTRGGFDWKVHRFTQLTAGDLGWIQQASMILVGIAMALLALGARQTLRTGRAAVWAPRLLALFGLAYVIGGALRADPVVGFPLGTTPDMVRTTWQGIVQNASRSASTLVLISLSGVIAGWFAAEGRLRWAWFYGAAIPVVFFTLAALGLAVGVNPVAPAFLLTPWVWVTALAVHLYLREANQPKDVPASPGTRTSLVAG